MIVKCIADNISNLPDSLQGFAFTQDDGGRLDLTIGKHYAVYGKELRSQRWFFLVHTDNDHKESFWWMPSDLYEITSESEPAKWQEIAENLFSYTSLSKWQVSEGLEDGDKESIAEFNSEVSADETFPSATTLDRLNDSKAR